MLFVARSRPPELSLVQQQRWAADRLEPGGHHNLALALRRCGPLDGRAIDRALESFARTHEALRAAFPGSGGKPRVHVEDRAVREMSFVDAGGLAWDDAQLAQRIADLARRPFDVERGPLWRTAVFRISEDEHLVLAAAHRLIADRASLRLLLRAMVDPSSVPELPEPRRLEALDVERELSRWRAELSSLETIALPTDRGRPRVCLRHRARESIVVSADVSQRIAHVAAAAAVAPAVVFAAAVELLVRCYSGRSEVAIGVADRADASTRFGASSRTLLLRNAVPEDASALDLLRSIAVVAAGAREQQSMDVESAAEALAAIGREPGVPVPQVMLDVEEDRDDGSEWIDVDTCAETADLLFRVHRRSGQVSGYLDYDRDLFDAATARRIVSHFCNALAGIAAGEPPARVSLAGTDERARILSASNALALRSPPAAAAHEMFEAHADRSPGDLALVSVRDSVTYGELEARANCLANYLRARGVDRSARVAILLERSVDAIVGILGVLKSGAAYVPLDAAFPRERIAAMCADASVQLVVTHSPLESRLPSGLEALRVDLDAEAIGASSAARPPRVADASDLAYVIYTSGSTGRPKGIGVEHRSLSSYVEAAAAAYGIGASDRVLQFAPLSFDASVEEIFLSLCRGATLVLRPEWMLDSVGLFLRKCGEWGVTALSLPTAYWHELARKVGAGEERLPASLRLVIIGGEAARADLVAAWLRRAGREVRLLNTYGPTETTVVATCWDASTADPDLPPRDIPIGKPLANSATYVLGPSRELLPIGVAGELYVGGWGVAHGYLGRDDLTADRFVADPFAALAGARMYRTGDRCRLLASGDLEFAGRTDEQVKVRGFRVEPAEIELHLAAHAAVEQAAVVARTADGGARLVAYVVTRERVEAKELLAFLGRRVPEFMVPSAIVFLARLPMTSSNKIDRRALAQIPETRSQRAAAAPRTPIEELVARAFCEALHVEWIGTRDAFLASGGSSLAAVQLATTLSDRLGQPVDAQDVFECSTVEALAQRIASRLHGRDDRRADADDLTSDVVLDPAVLPPIGFTDPVPFERGSIFLTGASGFFGAFLLRDVLRRSSGHAFCLVRSSNAAEGRARIAASWRRAFGAGEELPERVVAIPGDIAKPKLGLRDRDWDALAESSDAVVHAGALVSYLLPYRALRAANVLAVEEVLRLATHRKLKPVHHVSTVEVAEAAGLHAGETDELAPPASLPDGYAQSKWVAEGLAAIARQRGIPISVYRPGRLVGDTQTGVANENDFLLRVLQTCVRVGLAPRLDVPVDMTPVDYASAALVALAAEGRAKGVFHLVNPAPVRWEDLLRALEQFGYPVAAVPFGAWTAALAQSSRRAGSDPFAIYLSTLDELRVRAALESLHACDRTVARLEKHAIRCPTVDLDLIRMYLAQLVRSGFLPAP